MKVDIYNADCLEQLEKIQENSIDSIITDPPYELNFMGKGWDNAGVSFNKNTWEKCLKVLKLGGYLLAFGGSRTYHRIACAIEDAGFEIRDTIMWLYGSGFPKSMDISKQIDKRNGRTNNDFIEFGQYLKEKRSNKSQKEISKYFPSKTGGLTGCVSNWEKGVNVPTLKQYKTLKELLNLDNRFDWLIEREEAEREVIGQKKSNAMDAHKWLGEKYDKHESNMIDITAPSTDLAKQWQGWGTALKPSFEPIIVARKPFKGSLVDNVIEYGVGGINIDECRVEIDMANDPDLRKSKATNTKIPIVGSEHGKELGMHERHNPNGRFPANTILTYNDTDFDEVCGGFPKDNKGNSSARYFYCAKASKRDRDEGLDEFKNISGANITGRKEGSAGLVMEDGKQNPFAGKASPNNKNIHPTVKPTSLMQYLVRLVTPEGGIILDPFMGSGSTGKAVMFENKERQANYSFIGIEKEKEYCDIARARIEWAKNYKKDKIEDNQIHIDELGGLI